MKIPSIALAITFLLAPSCADKKEAKQQEPVAENPAPSKVAPAPLPPPKPSVTDKTVTDVEESGECCCGFESDPDAMDYEMLERGVCLGARSGDCEEFEACTQTLETAAAVVASLLRAKRYSDLQSLIHPNGLTHSHNADGKQTPRKSISVGDIEAAANSKGETFQPLYYVATLGEDEEEPAAKIDTEKGEARYDGISGYFGIILRLEKSSNVWVLVAIDTWDENP